MPWHQHTETKHLISSYRLLKPPLVREARQTSKCRGAAALARPLMSSAGKRHDATSLSRRAHRVPSLGTRHAVRVLQLLRPPAPSTWLAPARLLYLRLPPAPCQAVVRSPTWPLDGAPTYLAYRGGAYDPRVPQKAPRYDSAGGAGVSSGTRRSFWRQQQAFKLAGRSASPPEKCVNTSPLPWCFGC